MSKCRLSDSKLLAHNHQVLYLCQRVRTQFAGWEGNQVFRGRWPSYSSVIKIEDWTISCLITEACPQDFLYIRSKFFSKSNLNGVKCQTHISFTLKLAWKTLRTGFVTHHIYDGWMILQISSACSPEPESSDNPINLPLCSEHGLWHPFLNFS